MSNKKEYCENCKMVEDFSTQFFIRNSTIWLVDVISDISCIFLMLMHNISLLQQYFKVVNNLSLYEAIKANVIVWMTEGDEEFSQS